MGVTLRSRRLRCFYCGQWSSQTRDTATRQFKCEQCDAVNYLDSNGNITDPPAAVVAATAPVSYRPASPEQESSIFCSVCLKNQHLYRENLAAYLPPEDSPDYNRYVESLPAYKLKLDQRYPQVCANCAPAARDRIMRASYVAKTDHLRRMMNQSRGQGLVRKSSGWRGLLLSLAGLCALSSILVESSWHVASIAAQPLSEDLSQSDHLTSARHCSVQAVKLRPLDAACPTILQSSVPLALYSGAATFWWNNKLREKYVSTGGRMTGLLEAITLQLFALIVRAAAFHVLTTGNVISSKQEAVRGLHMFMLLFILITSLLSLTVVKIDRTPRISFNLRSSDILPNIPSSSSNHNPGEIPRTEPKESQFGNPRPYAMSVVSRNSRPFPIEALVSHSPAIAQQSHIQDTHQIPTPPPEDNHDPDAMDWTPSTPQAAHKLRPRPRVEPQEPQASAPSPFYGSLPAAPGTRNRRSLRNGQPVTSSSTSQLVFQKAPAHKTDDLFASMSKRKAIGSTAVEENTEDEDHNRHSPRKPARRTSSIAMNMSPARFFAPRDREKMETGLESMFDEVFRLKDEPQEVSQSSLDATDLSMYDADGSPGSGSPASQARRGLFELPNMQHSSPSAAAHDHNEAPRTRQGATKSRFLSATLIVLLATVPLAVLLGVAYVVKAVRGDDAVDGLRIVDALLKSAGDWVKPAAGPPSENLAEQVG